MTCSSVIAPKVVVFDVGNVLVRFSIKGLIDYMLECGVQITSEESFWQIAPIHDYERGAVSTEYFFARMLDACSKQADVKMIKRLWTEIFSPDLILLELAKKLNETYRVAILSNTSELQWNYLLKNYKLGEVSKFLMPSFELGYVKPEREIYLKAEGIVGATGSDILFFDDRIENVEAARHCGWQAIHYREIADVTNALGFACEAVG